LSSRALPDPPRELQTEDKHEDQPEDKNVKIKALQVKIDNLDDVIKNFEKEIATLKEKLEELIKAVKSDDELKEAQGELDEAVASLGAVQLQRQDVLNELKNLT
jgi:predicted RNase H-like nuclease (RuvC/YqgF family)